MCLCINKTENEWESIEIDGSDVQQRKRTQSFGYCGIHTIFIIIIQLWSRTGDLMCVCVCVFLQYIELGIVGRGGEVYIIPNLCAHYFHGVLLRWCFLTSRDMKCFFQCL